MKNFHFYLFSALFLFLFSCSKKEEDIKPFDRTESFKNTVWAGEFQYAAGDYTGTQPFSITLAEDGTLTWSDITSKRPAGNWVMKRDTITITLPNKTVISATVTDENWSNFKGGAAAGFFITQLNRATPIESAAIPNTTWKGTMGGSSLDINILPGMKMNYSLGGSPAISIPYTQEGAGIRFSYTGIISNSMNYVIFTNNTSTLKGIERRVSGLPSKTTYFSYAASKL